MLEQSCEWALSYHISSNEHTSMLPRYEQYGIF